MTALVRSLSMNNPGWEDYTPTFSTSDGGSIGNGTVFAQRRRVGDSVEIYCRVTFGTTTVFGTTAFNVTLPTGLARDPNKVLPTSNRVPGSVYLFDQSTSANDREGVVSVAASSNLFTFLPDRSTGATARQGVPFTWTNADAINFCATVPIEGW